MKKRVLCMLLALVMSLSLAVPAFAAEEQVPAADVTEAPAADDTPTVASSVFDSGTCGAEGDNLTWTLTDDGTLTISGTGAMADYSGYSYVPWKNYRYSFSDEKYITHIVIDQGVTTIGNHAFEQIKTIQSVSLPSGLVSIGANAFNLCNGLSSINLPSGLTSIGKNAFSGCVALTSVSIPNSVTQIGSSAFYNSGLKSITIPGSVLLIDDGTFAYCPLTSVTIGNGVMEVDNNAFKKGISQVSVTLPESVIEVGYQAFQGCLALQSVTIENPNCDISAGEETLGVPGKTTIFGYTGTVASTAQEYAGEYGYTFSSLGQIADWVVKSGVFGADGDNLKWELYSDGAMVISGQGRMGSLMTKCPWELLQIKTVTIKDGVTDVGDYAFDFKRQLTKVVLPDSVTEIGFNAFSLCSALTEINIPDSVTTIGVAAFSGCESLKEFHFPQSLRLIMNRAFDGCKNERRPSRGSGANWL